MARPRLGQIFQMALGAMLLFGGLRYYEHNRTREVYMPMKPYAVGRFLLDIPDPSTLAGWGRQHVDALGETKVFPGIQLRDFQKMIQARVQELKSEEMDFRKFPQEGSVTTVPAGHGTLLEKYLEGPFPNEHHILFWDDTGVKRDYCRFETYYWLQEPRTLPGTGTGYCFSGQGTPIDPKFQRDYLADDSKWLSYIQLRRDDIVPEGPGFCFQGSFVSAPPREKGFEVASAEWSLKNHPDVVISIYLQGAPATKSPQSLLQRNKAPMPEALLKFVRGIRANKRTVGDFAGEEVVERVKEENGTFGFSAQWEFEGGERLDLSKPLIVLTMSSGNGDKEGVNSSVSESQFLDMWDAVVESLRLRPTGPAAPDAIHPTSPATPDAAPKPKVSLGTSMPSGAPCPQAGTWECAHSAQIGGTRLAFPEGKILPLALLPHRRSLTEWLKREPDETVEDTTWTLVDYQNES